MLLLCQLLKYWLLCHRRMRFSGTCWKHVDTVEVSEGQLLYRRCFCRFTIQKIAAASSTLALLPYCHSKNHEVTINTKKVQKNLKKEHFWILKVQILQVREFQTSLAQKIQPYWVSFFRMQTRLGQLYFYLLYAVTVLTHFAKPAGRQAKISKEWPASLVV